MHKTKQNVRNSFFENHEENGYLPDPEEWVTTKLRKILKDYDVRLWLGLIWLRTRKTDGLLYKQS
jgi:hypothetical protein